MEAKIEYPFAAIRGALDLKGQYYARLLNGKCVIQRKPNRKNHIPTPSEIANQQRFIAKYAAAWRKQKKYSTLRGFIFHCLYEV